MKTLKTILIVIVVIIAIPLILGLFAPKHFYSERSIIIDRPKDEVFNYIRFVRNQDNFGVWQLSDPNLKFVEEGTDGTEGYKYTWDGEKTGQGSQTIILVAPTDSVVNELDFGFGDPVQSFFKVYAIDSTSTEVIWGLRGTSPYPLNVMNLFFDVGKDFEQGLANLKNVLEKP